MPICEEYGQLRMWQFWNQHLPDYEKHEVFLRENSHDHLNHKMLTSKLWVWWKPFGIKHYFMGRLTFACHCPFVFLKLSSFMFHSRVINRFRTTSPWINNDWSFILGQIILYWLAWQSPSLWICKIQQLLDIWWYTQWVFTVFLIYRRWCLFGVSRCAVESNSMSGVFPHKPG